MHALIPIIAAGWYTPETSTPSAPDATIVWGIAVIVAFLLGCLARGDKQPWRIRAYFDDLNERLHEEAELRTTQRDSQLRLADDANEHPELVGEHKLPPAAWN